MQAGYCKDCEFYIRKQCTNYVSSYSALFVRRKNSCFNYAPKKSIDGGVGKGNDDLRTMSGKSVSQNKQGMR